MKCYIWIILILFVPIDPTPRNFDLWLTYILVVLLWPEEGSCKMLSHSKLQVLQGQGCGIYTKTSPIIFHNSIPFITDIKCIFPILYYLSQSYYYPCFSQVMEGFKIFQEGASTHKSEMADSPISFFKKPKKVKWQASK